MAAPFPPTFGKLRSTQHIPKMPVNLRNGCLAYPRPGLAADLIPTDAESRAATRGVGVHAHRCQPPWE